MKNIIEKISSVNRNRLNFTHSPMCYPYHISMNLWSFKLQVEVVIHFTGTNLTQYMSFPVEMRIKGYLILSLQFRYELDIRFASQLFRSNWLRNYVQSKTLQLYKLCPLSPWIPLRNTFFCISILFSSFVFYFFIFLK